MLDSRTSLAPFLLLLASCGGGDDGFSLPGDIGDAMITDPDAELVTFTGSVAVGKMIAERAGYRRTVLELGGNDPLIVMEDADVDQAAELAVAGATKNSGQRCTAVKRILVVDAVADAFVERLVEKAAKLRCGDPMDPSVSASQATAASPLLISRGLPEPGDPPNAGRARGSATPSRCAGRRV